VPNAQQGQFDSTFLDCLPLPGSLAPDRDSQTQARIPQPTLVCSNRLFQGSCRTPSCTSCFKRSAHDQRSTTLPSRNFRIVIPGRSYLLPVGGKLMRLPDCTPDIVNRLTTRSPASSTFSIVSKGPFSPGIERFAQAPLYRATMPALSSGSVEYPCNTRVVHIQVSVEVACVPVFDGVLKDFKIGDRIDCQESPPICQKAILRNESMAAAISDNEAQT
jgi:hypothetical protein